MKTTIFLSSVLVASTSSLSINCLFENISWQGLPFEYGCIVNNLTRTESNSIESVTGIHQRLRSNRHVTQVWFGFNGTCFGLEFIPQGLSQFFRNMWGLNIRSECLLGVINESDLYEYTNLEYFSINGNRIERIPDNFFARNTRLTHVFFAVNRIRRVADNVLSLLPNLIFADFNINDCISMAAKNRSQVLSLIEMLRVNCPDVSLTTPATTTVRYCSNTNIPERICDLEAENETLRTKVEDLTRQIENIWRIISSNS
jgi:hypothetical protein